MATHDALAEKAIRRQHQRIRACYQERLENVSGSDPLRRWALEQLATDVKFDGTNPVNIARALYKLARSYTGLPVPVDRCALEAIVHQETALAQSVAKLELMRANGAERYDVVTAGDDRVCGHCETLASGGPYPIGAGKVPGWPHCMRCRCTVRSAL